MNVALPSLKKYLSNRCATEIWFFLESVADCYRGSLLSILLTCSMTFIPSSQGKNHRRKMSSSRYDPINFPIMENLRKEVPVWPQMWSTTCTLKTFLKVGLPCAETKNKGNLVLGTDPVTYQCITRLLIHVQCFYHRINYTKFYVRKQVDIMTKFRNIFL